MNQSSQKLIIMIMQLNLKVNDISKMDFTINNQIKRNL